MEPAAATVWAGIDVGKTHHWVEVVDACGATLLSRRVRNDQVEIDAILAAVVPLAETVLWAVDIVGSPSALLLALLADTTRMRQPRQAHRVPSPVRCGRRRSGRVAAGRSRR